MNPIEKLSEMFISFPGIGPRQARRFVYFLLRQPTSYTAELLARIDDVKKNIKICKKSYAYFYSEKADDVESPISRDPNRDKKTLMVVEKDADLENIEKTHTYRGQYFVLGGSLPILEKKPEEKIRIRELIKIIEDTYSDELTELIIATNANPEGDNTSLFVTSRIKEKFPEAKFKISYFGRGLSTGTELEYSDSETISNALKNRSTL